MHIMAAARYLEVGYRVRRTCWEPEEYIKECAGFFERLEIHDGGFFNPKTRKFENRRSQSIDHMSMLQLEDLLADDWEVITNGIRKEFNKYGDLEYEGETDWNNYEPSLSGWGYDEDE